MATRYSGDLKISVTYTDHGDYRTSVSRAGRLLWRGRVRPAAAGFGPGIAYDSERAYDEIARAALSFADNERSGIGDSAELDAHGFKIRRVAQYWQKWPGGQVRPKKLRDARKRRPSSRRPARRRASR